MKRVAIGLSILAVILVVGVLILYSSLGAIITKAVNSEGPEIILAKVHLDETVIDATSGKGSLHGLFIGNPEGFETESAFKMDKIEIVVDPGSITSGTIVINKIDIQAPEVTYELGGGGSNVDAIQKNVDAYVKKTIGASESKEKSEANEGGTKMVIDHLYVKDGKVNISASLLGGKSMTVPLPDIHLKDIGKEKKGAAPAEVAKSVIGALNKAIIKAVAPLNLDKVGEVAGKAVEGAKDVVSGTTKKVGDTLKKGTEGVTDSVKGLFGK
jgi:uncharacterized protein involved in outer membrane biogenesis